MRSPYTTEHNVASTITLAPDWRVRPQDELQWVLEHQRPGLKGGGARWDAKAYCTTRLGWKPLYRA